MTDKEVIVRLVWVLRGCSVFIKRYTLIPESNGLLESVREAIEMGREEMIRLDEIPFEQILFVVATGALAIYVALR